MQAAWDKLDASEPDIDPDLTAQWWSGYVPNRMSMVHDIFGFMCFSLHATKWAFLCVELEEVVDNEGTAYRMGIRPTPGTDLIKSMTIDDPREWKVWDPTPRWLSTQWPRVENAPIGLGWPMPEDTVTLLQHILLKRTPFSVDELGLALTEFKLTPHDAKLEELSKLARLKLLVEGEGFDDPQSVLAAYAAPAPPPPPERDDPELDGLLEELAEDLADNAADLKAYRGQLKQKAHVDLGKRG